MVDSHAQHSPNIEPTLGERLAFAVYLRSPNDTSALRISSLQSQISTKHLPKAGSMLAHRFRRWPSIEPTLGGRL